MELPSEYSFQFKDQNKNIRTIYVNRLDIEIFDNVRANAVSVKLKGFNKFLTLWSGPEYAAIGDYTQKQVEDRILELLGPDIKRGLFNLSSRFLPYEDEPSSPPVNPTILPPDYHIAAIVQ